MQGARTRARVREVEKTKIRSTQTWFSEVRFILLQASNKNIGRFPKNVGLFPKNVGDFFKNVGSFSAYLPRFFYTLRCTIPFTREISHRTTTYSTAGTWLCPVIPISQHTKGSATEDEWSKTMAQPQSTLKRQSWVDCRARSAGGEGTTPMLGESYSSRQ